MERTGCGNGGDGDEVQRFPTLGVQTRSMKRKLDEEAASQQGSSSSVRVDDFFNEDFQRTLKERKAELKRLAEGKRLEGLRKIEGKNSKTGVQPLEHFPKEVWCLILNELTTPSDMANLWQVHPLFLDLMEKDEIGDILFPLIHDRETGFIQKYLDDHNHWWKSELNTTLLELRRVSKGMRNAIDKWFEDDLFTFFSPHMITSWRIHNAWDLYKEPIHFRMAFDEAELLKMLDIRRPAKIFKRDIIVDVVNPDRYRRYDSRNVAPEDDVRIRCFNLFVANVTKALEEIGDQIWRFKLYCREMDEQGVFSTQTYTLLREWCGHLPNVKFIDIHFDDPAFGHISCSEAVNNSSVWNEEFPTLNGLKRLDLYSSEKCKFLELFAESIVSANPQIKMVNLNGHLDYQFMSRPCIKALELELCQLRIDACPVLFKEMETAVGNFNWNLKMLDLSFNGTEPAIYIQSLIQLLNRFPTLESLFVSNYLVKFSDEEIDFLRLSNLTRFGLSFCNVNKREYDGKTHFLFSLQFLLHSSKLETISWSDNSFIKRSVLSRWLCRRIQSYEAVHPGEMLDFGGGHNDLNGSNLWDVFPNLKLIEVYVSGTEINETFRKSRGFLSSLP